MKYILTLGLRFYEGQIYLISPKFIINTKEKLKKKIHGGHMPPPCWLYLRPCLSLKKFIAIIERLPDYARMTPFKYNNTYVDYSNPNFICFVLNDGLRLFCYECMYLICINLCK